MGLYPPVSKVHGLGVVDGVIGPPNAERRNRAASYCAALGIGTIVVENDAFGAAVGGTMDVVSGAPGVGTRGSKTVTLYENVLGEPLTRTLVIDTEYVSSLTGFGQIVVSVLPASSQTMVFSPKA